MLRIKDETIVCESNFLKESVILVSPIITQNMKNLATKKEI